MSPEKLIKGTAGGTGIREGASETIVFISEQAYTQTSASLQRKQGPSLTGTGL